MTESFAIVEIGFVALQERLAINGLFGSGDVIAETCFPTLFLSVCVCVCVCVCVLG